MSTSVFLVWCRVCFVVIFCLILAVQGLEQASECSCYLLHSLATSAYLVPGAVNISLVAFLVIGHVDVSSHFSCGFSSS